jgi:acetolactate synthase-1/2/3 large subunit
MSKDRKSPVDRRNFLKGAAAGTAALVANPVAATAQQSEPRRGLATPTNVALAAETTTAPAPVEVLINERPGSDFMVDVIKSLGIEYCCANPGSSFRALHESIINYGGNKGPELITCCHEEASVAMAHGFAKIEGKPLMIMAHGTVGLQHASMAIYNAYADRVPLMVFLGNILDITYRRGGGEWTHSVQDAAAMVRDYTKWDDSPVTLAHFAESVVRAYRIAMTPPTEPVVLTADAKLQEEPITEPNLRIPRFSLPSPPQGDSGAVAEAAKFLVEAENPVIVAGKVARTPNGVKLLVELAETLQAPVHDQKLRMNFPTRHPLNGGGSARSADVVLALETTDLWDMTHKQTPLNRIGMESQPTMKAGAKLISISTLDLNHKSNYQDFGRYQEVDVAIAADTETTLPSLIEAVNRLLTGDRKRAIRERGAKLAEANQKAREKELQQAAIGWNSSPINTARMSMELWSQIKNDDWSLVSSAGFISNWPLRLWDFNKHYQYIGGHGAGGMGYMAPATIGAALANKKHGRLTVSIQTDGDLNYSPGALWTAAHHRIPILILVHNNRAYHQEVMQVQLMANRANRGIDRARIGTTLMDPDIDYAKMAQAYGMHGEGPISDPNDLSAAIQRGLEVVRSGAPALIDVVTQPR